MLKKSFSRGRRQPTPRPSPDRGGEDRRQETGEIGIIEEVGVRIVRMIFLP
ncbi:MAG: hypothetical protein F6K48_29700 [Okeania sp. SIO3H1]|nr:hypothetical protein [Okeania sp. SIO3H1]NET27309.1 hypothetical protein [Okeania sp. SIO1I7]